MGGLCKWFVLVYPHEAYTFSFWMCISLSSSSFCSAHASKNRRRNTPWYGYMERGVQQNSMNSFSHFLRLWTWENSLLLELTNDWKNLAVTFLVRNLHFAPSSLKTKKHAQASDQKGNEMAGISVPLKFLARTVSSAGMEHWSNGGQSTSIWGIWRELFSCANEKNKRMFSISTLYIPVSTRSSSLSSFRSFKFCSCSALSICRDNTHGYIQLGIGCMVRLSCKCSTLKHDRYASTGMWRVHTVIRLKCSYE